MPTGGVQVGDTTESSPWRMASCRHERFQRRNVWATLAYAGDMATIPAGTPHQMILAPGERVTYVAVKVAAPTSDISVGVA